MSSGYFILKECCLIGKKEDKSDCAKKDCDNCRHKVLKEVWLEYEDLYGRSKGGNNGKY